MFRIAFAFFVTLQSVSQAVPQSVPSEDITNALAHAEALYYGARFKESIELLGRVDEALKTQPGRIPEKINTKLRMALAHVGLNDTAKARALLMELYALDAEYVLDTVQYPPKVVTIAAEAKAEHVKTRCLTAQFDARSYLESAMVSKLLELLRSARSKCEALEAIGSEAAETFYKSGVAAYRQEDLSTALSDLEVTLELVPGHELALQYVDLIQSKLQVGRDRLFLQWQRNFNDRQWTAAAAGYRQLLSFNDAEAAATVKQVTTEYRKALTTLVETWNRSCSNDDPAARKAVASQISEMLPEPSFGEDIRTRMVVCKEPNQVAELSGQTGAIAADPKTGCFEMQPQLALTRLKTRVDPPITNEMRYYLRNNAQVVVRVKARISESGDVTVTGVADGNPMVNNAVRIAVAEWKFAPIRDNHGPRCVDTEIPIVIKLAQ